MNNFLFETVKIFGIIAGILNIVLEIFIFVVLCICIYEASWLIRIVIAISLMVLLIGLALLCKTMDHIDDPYVKIKTQSQNTPSMTKEEGPIEKCHDYEKLKTIRNKVESHGIESLTEEELKIYNENAI